MARLNRQLPASTLIEAVIAMVIVTVSFAAALMVMDYTASGRAEVQRYRVDHRLRSVLNEIERGEHMGIERLEEADFSIRIDVTADPTTAGLYRVRLEAENLDGVSLAVLQKLIYAP